MDAFDAAQLRDLAAENNKRKRLLAGVKRYPQGGMLHIVRD